MKKYDYIIVGAGITGSIIARDLAENGNRILVIDRRKHIGGNAFDYYNENGILVQQYGPHIFHTDSPVVESYVRRWGEWIPFKLACKVFMNGKYTPSPFNYQTIDDYFDADKAERIKRALENAYPGRTKVTIVELLESDNGDILEYARFLFDNDYKLYTAKQWGISPEEIDISVLKRVPVLLDYKEQYFDDAFQAMPQHGFTDIIKNILGHENICVELGVAASSIIKENTEKRLFEYDGGSDVRIIYTGSLDELFGYRFGHLPYRSLRFEWRDIDVESYQDAPVVAYPQEKGFTRITEYKKLPSQTCDGRTAIAIEYPLQAQKDAEPYYPIPTEANLQAYEQYKKEAEKYGNLCVCGRLADYKYYNMDQAILRALEICRSLNKNQRCL